jgi:hypothetical protein
MKPVMLSENTKKVLDEFKWNHREELLGSAERKFASYDKTILFLIANFRRKKQ